MDVNEQITKVTWKIEVLSDVHSKSMDVNGQVTKVTWRIENFSTIQDKKLCSENFTVDGNKWRFIIYPKGDAVDHLSIYLGVADSSTLPAGWIRYAHFGLAVIDQFDRELSITGVTTHVFNVNADNWGFPSFLPLTELRNPERGYLVNDACLVEAYVFTDRSIGFISHELIVKTDSDKLKTKESDCVKAAMDNQRTTSTKAVEITNPSPTPPYCQIMAIEPEEPTEEDMNTFFTSLESKLWSFNTIFSREEAKEALAKVEKALNMTPVNFYDSGKLSPLKHAFKILASFDCSSTTLTMEQKKELLAMEESLKELADRAAKALQDKNFLTEKESIKLTITHKLDRNVIRYKEVESEVKQVEKKLAALHVQVEEAQKERENMLAERKEIFKSSKEMKMELEALEKQWAEYEAMAKVAEEEESIVLAEWGRIKDFISSIKGKI
ncbi:MATH domain and coiled-coil domain-containing protein At3g58270-like isoform X1 [Gossypium arboreum]|uniref:MATH domain and coiled-coil domain-containing protein At3g58270-like isoform X1 n=1 Tax=Gossypium arboreum TaxID=29729 RepID=UPI0008195DF8|nr:MATH domain and coiled-coil domain-containing protein At3g58270-like isoform X1 [Gossypium arboreum]